MEEPTDFKIYPFLTFQTIIFKKKLALLTHESYFCQSSKEQRLEFLGKDTAIQFYQKDTVNTYGSFLCLSMQ